MRVNLCSVWLLGVAYAVARAAGSRFQRESDEYVTKNGLLNVAQVFAQGGGKLPCDQVNRQHYDVTGIV